MFRVAVVALMAVSASAFTGGFNPESVHARKLLKESTLIEGRGLGGGNNNNNNPMYNVMGNLHLKYTGCSNIYSLSGGQGGGGGNNNKNGQNGNLYNSAIVTYELREGCDGPLVGKYATNMMQFVDSYTESTMQEQEWKCENYREEVCEDLCTNNNNNGNNNNGNNNGNNRDACYYQCFIDSASSGGEDMTACAEYYQEGEAQDFEVQRYLQCGQLKNNNKNNNNNGNNNYNANQFDWSYGYSVYSQWDGVYRAGAYCAADGYSIFLGVFYDQQCAVKAPNSVYSDLNYGYTLPYTSTSLVPKDSCLSCVDAEKQYQNQQKQQNNNNNGNNQNANNQQWNNMEPRQFCINAYQQAVKCEDAESGYLEYGATTTGCDFIGSYLPKLSKSETSSTGSPKNAAVVLAWMFGATTVLFAVYAMLLARKVRQSGASGLSSQADLA